MSPIYRLHCRKHRSLEYGASIVFLGSVLTHVHVRQRSMSVFHIPSWSCFLQAGFPTEFWAEGSRSPPCLSLTSAGITGAYHTLALFFTWVPKIKLGASSCTASKPLNHSPSPSLLSLRLVFKLCSQPFLPLTYTLVVD